MKITLEEASEFPVLPDDVIVPARIVEIEAREPNEFRSWPDMSWKFVLLDVPEQQYASLVGSHLWGTTTQKFNLLPDNKLRQWLEAALGVDLTEPGVEIETDAAIGREVRILIGSYTGRKGKKNKVVGVVPAAKGGPLTPPVVADPWATTAFTAAPDLDEAPF